jgi:hypothetical protein
MLLSVIDRWNKKNFQILVNSHINIPKYKQVTTPDEKNIRYRTRPYSCP